MKIIKQGIRKWTNLHQTVSQQVVDVYDLVNDTGGTALQNYNETTQGIQALIRQSIDTGIPIRPLGGNWSLSPIAATSGIILNTKPLNCVFTVTISSVSAQYRGEARKLCFAQCGTSIWELNKFLAARGLSLSACGASNGQTIAGAIATGTHGAAIDFGAIQDAVVGLHVITGPDKHVFLERASYPVVADSFLEKLGARRVPDDEAFDAALTGIGAFGFVHGVMLEVEDLYLLEAYLRRVAFDDAYRHGVTKLDFTHPGLPFPGERPFHFQSLINPYDLQKGVYMTTMYKRPYRKDYTPPKPKGDEVGPGDDAPCFIGKLAGAIPKLVPTLVNNLLGSSLKPYERVTGTLGEIFNNTTLRGKVLSTAIGFPASETGKVIDMVLSVNKASGPFAGLFAFRFVKKSKALLAFTRFAPVTCVLELDGVQSPETMRFYEAVWKAMELSRIPHAFHWGKIHNLTPERVQKIYGADLQRFIAARSRILDNATLLAFSNDAYKDWGIDKRAPGGEVLV